MPLQSSRSCQVVMLRRSNVAVSPGPTVIEPARSSGCGSSARTMDRHGQVGPVVLTRDPHRDLAGIHPRCAGARVVAHERSRFERAGGSRPRTGGSRRPSPSSRVLPRGFATRLVMSNVTDSSSVTSGGSAPARSASDRSSSPGTCRNPYVVTSPDGPSPVTANGMTRVISGSSPRSSQPSTVTPCWSPHRLRVRSSTSPPDHVAWSVSTSTPVGKSSRVSAVSTVSSTTG